MKHSSSAGFEQAYNAQVAVDQDSLFIVACALSNHPNDKAEIAPTLDALPAELGTPPAAALDNGFFSPANIAALEARGIEPYIATGREPHHPSWQERFAAEPEPPPANASPQVTMAYKLRTAIGKAIYRLRKCTVEPVTPALVIAGASVGIISSRPCWASASSRYAAWRRPAPNGAGSVWPSTSSASIP